MKLDNLAPAMAKSSSLMLVIALLLLVSLVAIVSTGNDRLPLKRSRRQGFVFQPSGSSSTGESCNTPDGKTGQCIEIVKCEEAAAILAGSPTGAQRRFLRERTCRFEGPVPFFCCVEGGGSPDVIVATPAPVTVAPTAELTTPPTAAPEPIAPSTEPPVVITPAPVVIVTEAPPVNRDNEPSEWTLARLREVCGISKAPLVRVVGGQLSELEYWPWMAALFIGENGVKTFDFVSCGGVLISERYILTAAHCVVNKATGETRKPSDITVRLGDLDISNDTDGATPINIDAEQVIPHEQYNAAAIQNDIALIRLSSSVSFTSQISPICLPTEEKPGTTFDRMQPHIAGWGTVQFEGESSSGLRHVQIQVTSNTNCQQAYRRFRITIAESQLCAGFQAGGKDACQGDSGGPLMIPRSRKWTTIGVVSVGFRCAEVGFPGIYARTTFYLDWIKKHALLQ